VELDIKFSINQSLKKIEQWFLTYLIPGSLFVKIHTWGPKSCLIVTWRLKENTFDTTSADRRFFTRNP